MNELKFKTIEEANSNGFITVKQAGRYAKIVDVSGGNQFGYKFSALSYMDKSVKGETVTVQLTEEKSIGGRKSSVAPMFRVTDLR